MIEYFIFSFIKCIIDDSKTLLNEYGGINEINDEKNNAR